MKKRSGFIETLLHFKNYLSANIATKALGFISIPVLTRLLSPADYGIVSIFNSYIALLSVILTLNVHVSLGRYFYEDKEDFNSFFGTSAFLTVGILVFMSLVFFFFRDSIRDLFNLPMRVVLLMIPMVCFDVADSMFKQIYQPLRESKKVAIVMMLKAYSSFGLSVIIIFILKDTLFLGPILASVIIGFFFAMYFIMRLKTFFYPSFKISYIKYILHYSIPLIPYTLSGYILAQFDRIMINSYRGSSDAGLYSLAYNIGMLLSIVIGSLNAAWMPKYFEYMNEKKYGAHDRDIERLFRLIMIVALFLMLFGKEIGIALAQKDYHAALQVIPVIVIGYIFYGIFTVYGRNIGYAKKTIYSSLVLLLSGFMNILLNVIFIPRYGYIAAAYTTLVSYFFMALCAWIVNKYIIKLHSTPLKLIVVPFALTLPFILAFLCIEYLLEINIYIALVLKIVILLIALFILLYKQFKDIRMIFKRDR